MMGSPDAIATDAAIEVDPPARFYVCRIALVILRLPRKISPSVMGAEVREEAHNAAIALRGALEGDTRVASVDPIDGPAIADNSRTLTYFEVQTDKRSLLEALTTYEGLRLDADLVFTIRVPAKNQPKYRSMDDVPSDEYLVRWNGICLAIQWSQSDPRATGSGGHIVFDILADVARAAGYSTEVLACSAGCLHRFAHLDFVTFPTCSEDQRALGFVPTEQPISATTVVAPFAANPNAGENLHRTFGSVVSAVEAFGGTRTLANSISFLEGRAWGDSTELLTLGYVKASRPGFPHLVALAKAVWNGRAARRRSKELIAELWLVLATVDTHVGYWRGEYKNFTSLLGESRMSKLRDYFETGQDTVESLNLATVSTSLQEVASRIEGRGLLIATVAGALAALAGAAVAALLT